jgi:GLPGLI family protein
MPDSSKPEKIVKDIWWLYIGNKSCSFFSYSKYRHDSLFQANLESGNIREYFRDPAQQRAAGIVGLYSNCKLFINYPEGKITITDQASVSQFIYEEIIEKINWNISNDTATYLNYLCQKATCTFRGRDYIAWFAPGIPLNSGPYKFHGLPGLILKIYDSKNNYRYECIGIEKFSQKKAIELERKTYIKTTRTEFRKLFKSVFDNPMQTMMLPGVTIAGKDAEKIKASLQKSIPYNPIELE